MSKTGRVSILAGAALVIVAGAAAYHNSLTGVFLYDDGVRILSNPLLEPGTPLRSVLMRSSRPLVDLTFAANLRLGGAQPRGFHVVNLAIHLVSGLLLFGLVRRTLLRCRLRGFTARAASAAALLTAIVWVAHPLTTSAVTYIVQRYELLMACFYLLTLYAVVRSVETGSEIRRYWWRLLACLGCALGMLCKEVMVTAPVAVLMYDWVFVSRGAFRPLWKRRMLYAGLACSWIVLAALIPAKLHYDDAQFYAWRSLTPLQYAVTEWGVLVRYLRLAVWPSGLCFDYAWPATAGILDILLPAIVTGGLVAVAAYGTWRARCESFPVAFFLLVLAPTSTVIVRPDPIMEYRAYLPLAAVVALLIVAAWRGAAWIRGRVTGGLRSALRIGAGAVTVALPLLLIALSILRNDVYASAERMWADVLGTCPDNRRARLNLVSKKLGSERYAESLELVQPILTDLAGYADVAAAAVPAEVTGAAEAAVYRDVRHYAHAHNYAGVALAGLRRLDPAERHFREAVRILPQFAEARRNLARVREERGALRGTTHHDSTGTN